VAILAKNKKDQKSQSMELISRTIDKNTAYKTKGRSNSSR